MAINHRIQTCSVVFLCLLTSAVNTRQARTIRSTYSLTAEVVNSTSVSLKWQTSSLSTSDDVDNGDTCSPRLFLIRLKQEGARRVRTWKVDGLRSSVSLHGLIAGTAYSVRIVSVDCHGQSRPSRWVNIRTADIEQQQHQPAAAAYRSTDQQRETVVPGQPVDVTTRAFSDSVFVSWKAPGESIPVRGYVVGYGEGVPDVSWQYMEPHRRNVTIKNLKKETQYVVSVRAFNNIGKGPVVYDLVYTTDSSVDEFETSPVASPVNLQSKVLSATTVWLQWTDPSIGRQQVVPDSRYYNVHYQAVQPAGKALSAVARDLNVVLYNLLPATRYEFKVRTVKDSQTSSQYSTVITNRTHETAPSSAPRDVRVTSVPDDVTNVRIKWRAPRHSNGNITEYLIFYASNDGLPSERWLIQSVIGSDTETVLQQLNASTTYYLRVQARNSHGFGPKSDIIKYTSLPANNNNNIKPTSFTGTVSPVSARAPDVKDNSTGSAMSNITDSTEQQSDDQVDETRDKVDDKGADMMEGRGEERENEDEDDDDETHYDYIDNDDTNNNNNNTAGMKLASSKAKREPNPVGLSPTDTETVKSPTTTNVAATDTQQISFQSLVTHHISVYITWPQYPTQCASGSGGRRGGRGGGRVVGYQLRYGRQTDSGEYVSRYLTQNVVLLEGLSANTRYVYQLKYIMKPDIQSVWSQQQILDTTPPAEQY